MIDVTTTGTTEATEIKVVGTIGVTETKVKVTTIKVKVTIKVTIKVTTKAPIRVKVIVTGATNDKMDIATTDTEMTGGGGTMRGG